MIAYEIATLHRANDLLGICHDAHVSGLVDAPGCDIWSIRWRAVVA